MVNFTLLSPVANGFAKEFQQVEPLSAARAFAGKCGRDFVHNCANSRKIAGVHFDGDRADFGVLFEDLAHLGL